MMAEINDVTFDNFVKNNFKNGLNLMIRIKLKIQNCKYSINLIKNSKRNRYL
jgi:hypothetical protein